MDIQQTKEEVSLFSYDPSLCQLDKNLASIIVIKANQEGAPQLHAASLCVQPQW